MGIFKKINFGLRKTRNNVSGAIDNVLDSYTSIDQELFDELEEALVMGDVGVTTASEITLRLNDVVRKKGIKNPADVKAEIKDIVAEMLEGGEDMGLITIPSVILVIGVNGVGKTTTIGKLAARYKAEGKSVILAAADTFRAAAIDQLDVWAERAGVDIVKHKEGADPAAVIFDTISAAKARGTEIIICDTAGRLHNKKNLMEELGKIYRVIVRFVTEIVPVEAKDGFVSTGADEVRFLISANAGEKPGRISKIASGGELSRIMLAMKSVFAEADPVPTLVFDEIDTGISGIAAQRVAEKIAGLANTVQIICVTHLPQIAAMGTHNFRIAKQEKQGRTFTSVTPLDYNDKTKEIARLQSGEVITQISLDGAAELIRAADAFKQNLK